MPLNGKQNWKFHVNWPISQVYSIMGKWKTLYKKKYKTICSVASFNNVQTLKHLILAKKCNNVEQNSNIRFPTNKPIYFFCFLKGIFPMAFFSLNTLFVNSNMVSKIVENCRKLFFFAILVVIIEIRGGFFPAFFFVFDNFILFSVNAYLFWYFN